MSDESFEEEVLQFLRRNFPQIQMHGGDATVKRANASTGEVAIRLSGACSGCGISPMTVQAIKSRMTDQLSEVETVLVDTGEQSATGDTPNFDTDSGEDDPHIDAPF